MDLGRYEGGDKFVHQELNKRQDGILDLLMQEGQVKLAQLSKHFGVTEITIRRDLEKMEQQGVLVRTFGGAILSRSKDVSIDKREKTMSEEKARIGKAAAELVQPGEIVFIDSGTTTPYVVKFLNHAMPITVVTHAINIAIELQNKGIRVMVLGGMLWEGSSSLVGPDTEEALKKLAFDRALISATGFTIEHGFSNSNIFELQLKKLAAQQAKEASVLIDHSKFGFRSLASFASIDQVHAIVTDRQPDAAFVEHCKAERVNLIVAE